MLKIRQQSDAYLLLSPAGQERQFSDSANTNFRPVAAGQVLEDPTFNVEMRSSQSEAEGTISAACGCPARLPG